MRTPVIAANWKMYKTSVETVQFIDAFLPLVEGIRDVEVVLSPPFTSLLVAREKLKDSTLKLCAQNVHFEKEGAYTGEISADMIADCNCSHVIIGHSERRQYFNEGDDLLNRKVKAAISAGLTVIFCIGETLDERESGKTFDVVGSELKAGLKDIDLSNIVIAYEPIWAIGTGKTATPEQAQEVHAFIREALGGMGDAADSIRILYGGSVKPANIKILMEMNDIDGALVGGASLDPVSFSEIVKFNE